MQLYRFYIVNYISRFPKNCKTLFQLNLLSLLPKDHKDSVTEVEPAWILCKRELLAIQLYRRIYTYICTYTIKLMLNRKLGNNWDLPHGYSCILVTDACFTTLHT